MENLERLENAISYDFKDHNLLHLALTHPSYNEHRTSLPQNQRLEFLGDSILNLVLSEELYKMFPGADEGELTQKRASLVQGDTLTKIAKKLNLSEYIQMSKAELANHGHLRKSTLEDSFEALLGAVYLDGGLESARNIIMLQIKNTFGGLDSAQILINAKGRLQEWIQEKPEFKKIKYVITHESGPAHNRSFRAEVSIDGKIVGHGNGDSKKSAETKAAEMALGFLVRNQREAS